MGPFDGVLASSFPLEKLLKKLLKSPFFSVDCVAESTESLG
jgi:hypothetical protein